MSVKQNEDWTCFSARGGWPGRRQEVQSQNQRTRSRTLPAASCRHNKVSKNTAELRSISRHQQLRDAAGFSTFIWLVDGFFFLNKNQDFSPHFWHLNLIILTFHLFLKTFQLVFLDFSHHCSDSPCCSVYCEFCPSNRGCLAPWRKSCLVSSPGSGSEALITWGGGDSGVTLSAGST